MFNCKAEVSKLKACSRRSYYFLFLLIFFCNYALADAQQITAIWSGIDISGPLPGSPGFLYDLNGQDRYRFSGNVQDLTRGEAGMGYTFMPSVSGWFGYTWILRNANTRQVNIPWQQIQWNVIQNNKINFVSRTRLQELKDNRSQQWSDVLRQRLLLSLPKKIADTLTPVIYDEVFIRLKNADWLNTNNLISNNQLFVGVDVPILQQTNLRIGYLNRYRFRKPNNQVDHIIFINLNIAT